MHPGDPVLFRQIPVIQKIIQDETWLEGERRGCAVPPTDCVVRENVCRVVLQVGQQLRDSVTRDLPEQVRNVSTTTECGSLTLMVPDGAEWEI